MSQFDQESDEQEQKLMKIWQQPVLPAPEDASQMARQIAGKVQKFDRRIWWRNLREYAAGAVLIAYFSWRSFDPAARLVCVAGIVAVAWVMFYIWRNHRHTPPLDPAADGKSYQAALLDRYDCQIRLLRGVKYWYVLPLYLWMLLNNLLMIPAHETGQRIGNAIGVTAFSLFVIWLNEGYGVKKLKDKRRKAEALWEEGNGE